MSTQADSKQLRIFGLALSAAITFWLVIYCWLSQTDLLTFWPVWLVIILLTDFALFKPAWLAGLFRVWMIFAEWLNRIITYSLLGSIFFVLITPIAWLRRLSGHDALRNKKYLPGSFRVKSHASTAKDMEQPF